MFLSRNHKHILISLISLMAVLANLFVIKQISLFGFSVTSSDVFAVGSILGLNILQEYHGKEEARRASIASLIALIFFILVSQIHLIYTPLSIDTTQSAFERILSTAPRICFASLAVYFFVQRVDIHLFSWFKKLFSGKFFSMRVGLSLMISQWIDTVLFSFFGLYGLVDTIFDVIVLSFTIKCIVIAMGMTLTAFVRRLRVQV
jgi:uncharacterized integral membrane protein (TIGR00697 family)